MKLTSTVGIIAFCLIAIVYAVVWYQVFASAPSLQPRFDFLEVGQGDSHLVTLAGGVTLLVDAGPSIQVVESLESVMPWKRTIDLAIISHPEVDHFGGFAALLDRFHVRTFLLTGREPDTPNPQWKVLMQKVEEKNIPVIQVQAGDMIRHGDSKVFFLSPDTQYLGGGELNDTALVELVDAPPVRALLTADIGIAVEKALMEKYRLKADILKVGHHGSKFSSDAAFLQAVDPVIVVIQAGKDNRYGHPHPDMLQRISKFTDAAVLRTDQQGTVTIEVQGEKLKTRTFQEL